jgi:uncharacterized protein (TIGR01244 family)
LAVLVLLFLAECVQLVSDDTSFTSSFTHVLFANNLHEIEPGILYRSAEMSDDDLQRVIREEKIGTVLDLRFKRNGLDSRVTEEKHAANEAGADYYHFPLRGSRLMTKEQILALVDIYNKAKYPILLHCSSGTHRSGMATAIWQLTKGGKDFATASEQLTPKYGFFRGERQLKSLFQGHPTIDNVLWQYHAAELETGISFIEWAKKQDKLGKNIADDL